jgi:hypothetical protein
MYTKLKNPAKDIVVSSTSISDKEGNVSKIETFGDSDIFTVFKKYKLPHE